MLDSSRGVPRMRVWPKKRGKNLPAITAQNNAIFTERNRLAKYAASQLIIAAMETTKGTGLYPRDLLMRAMATGLYDVEKPDLTFYTHRRDRIDFMPFQGFILQLIANQFIGTNVSKAPIWPLPVRDTAQFFNAGAPTLITVPIGVTVMEFFSGHASAFSNGGRMLETLHQNGGAAIKYDNRQTSGTGGMAMSSGPIVVAAGDQIEVRFFMSSGGTINGTPQTFFAGQILEAS